MTTAKNYVQMLNRIRMGWDEEYDSVYDYITNGALEAQVLRDVNTNENVGVVVLLAMGGPTVWLNTYRQVLVASELNGGYSAEEVFSDICEEINEAFGIY